jgi:hypothetical protein
MIFFFKKNKEKYKKKDTYRKDESLWCVEKYREWNYISRNTSLSEGFFFKKKYID